MAGSRKEGAMPLFGEQRRKTLQEAVDMYAETGSKTEAARRLGVPGTTLADRLKVAAMEGVFHRTKAEPGEVKITPGHPDEYSIEEITGIESLGVINDIHIPYHDPDALSAAIRSLQKLGCDGLLLNGDIVDCYSQSWWERIPARRDYSYELRTSKAVLSEIRKAFPKIKMWYRSGNHEVRHLSYLSRNCPELYDVPDVRLDSLLGLAGLGMKWIDEKTQVKYDKLYIIHGHEYRIGRAVINPAKVMLDRARKNIMSGHFHVEMKHSHRSIDESVTAAWCVPCLSHLHADFAPLNSWQHGFAHVGNGRDGFLAQVHLLIKGKVY